MRRFLTNWLPVLVWLGMIFFGSTDLMSTEHTSRFILPFLHWLNPDVPPATLASIHFAIRKGAHVAEYAVLALLLFRAAICVTSLKRSPRIFYASLWTGCLLVAVTDELHQAFVASRGASANDVVIDSAGALLGLLIAAIFARRGSAKIGKTTGGS